MCRKHDIRAAVLARRDALDAQARAHKSKHICEQAQHALDAWAAGRGARFTVAAYAAMRSEVDVAALIEAAYARGWRVCLPCMVREGGAGEGPQRAAGRRSEGQGGASGGLSIAAADAAANCEDPAPHTAEKPQRAATRMAFLDIPRERLEGERPAFLEHPARALPRDVVADGGWEEVAPARIDAVIVPLVAFDGACNRLGYGGGNYDRFLAQLPPDAFVAGVAFEEQRIDAVPTEPHDQPLPRIFTA